MRVPPARSRYVAHQGCSEQAPDDDVTAVPVEDVDAVEAEEAVREPREENPAEEQHDADDQDLPAVAQERDPLARAAPAVSREGHQEKKPLDDPEVHQGERLDVRVLHGEPAGPEQVRLDADDRVRGRDRAERCAEGLGIPAEKGLERLGLVEPSRDLLHEERIHVRRRPPHPSLRDPGWVNSAAAARTARGVSRCPTPVERLAWKILPAGVTLGPVGSRSGHTQAPAPAGGPPVIGAGSRHRRSASRRRGSGPPGLPAGRKEVIQ